MLYSRLYGSLSMLLLKKARGLSVALRWEPRLTTVGGRFALYS